MTAQSGGAGDAATVGVSSEGGLPVGVWVGTDGAVRVGDGVRLTTGAVAVRVGVGDGVGLGPAVDVRVGVALTAAVAVRVAVAVAVAVRVAVRVGVLD